MMIGKGFDEKVSYNLLTMYSDCDGTLLSYLASKWLLCCMLASGLSRYPPRFQPHHQALVRGIIAPPTMTGDVLSLAPITPASNILL